MVGQASSLFALVFVCTRLKFDLWTLEVQDLTFVCGWTGVKTKRQEEFRRGQILSE